MKMTSAFLKSCIAGVAFAALSAASAGQAQEAQTLNVLLPNENTTVFYPLIVARDLGFFKDEGVDINVLSAETTIPYVVFLSNRQADVVMLDAPQTFQAVNRKLPISVIYEANQFAPEVVAVSADSPIKDITELKGKTVGLASDRDLITLKIALDAVGRPIEDVETVVVGDAGPTLANAFRNQTVAAVAAAINDLATLEGNGIKVRDITPPGVSENPANSFVINKERTEELRPVVTKFLRAWAMGAAAGKIDPQVVAALAAQSIAEEWVSKPAGQALLQVALKMNHPQTGKYGGLQPEVWKKIQAPLVKFGELEAEVDPATFLDPSFIDEANNFDEAKVKAALEEWKAANPELVKEANPDMPQ